MARDPVQDISSSAEGASAIASTARHSADAGRAVYTRGLRALRVADGSVFVLSTGASLRKDGSGVDVTALTTAVAPMGIAAAPYWSPVGDNCFSHMRGSAEFFACYDMFKMIGETQPGDYWRLDFAGTMFANGTKLKSGWMAVDQDAGPLQSWTAFSPPNDGDQNCGTIGVGITVLGVGASHTYTRCEVWDITKSTGTTMGYFKNAWNWGTKLPLLDADRSLALMIGTKGATGSPTYGLSWDFTLY